MTEIATFVCSICNEPSANICARCTKDACPNHRCARCLACSDCCECEVPLTAPEPETVETLPESVELVDPLIAPPEASEEPDLNLLPATVFEQDMAEEVQPEPEHTKTPDPHL